MYIIFLCSIYHFSFIVLCFSSLLFSGIHSGLLQLFQSSSSPSLSSLSFSNLTLQPKHSPSLCHTLLAYPSLSSLSFSGVLLTDSSLSHFGKLLSNLPTLYHLDLSCTGITSSGLQSLSYAVTTQSTSSTASSKLHVQTSLYIMDTVSLLYRGVLYVEVILYSKECNWYTRCCLLNGGVRYRECPLRETILYM